MTLELRPGITGLVGSNGAGKSTLMRLATGQLSPTWAAFAFGRRVWQPREAGRVQSRHRHVLRGIPVASSSGHGQALRLPERRFSSRQDALDLVGMATGPIAAARLFQGDASAHSRSRRRLVHDPEVLILDEPLSGIDPIGRQDFLALFMHLVDRGKCLLVSSHELEELEKLTERVAVMAQGRIAAVGTLAQIRDLLDDHPFRSWSVVRQPRQFAGALLGLQDVVAVEIGERDSIVVQAPIHAAFYADFAGLVLEENYEIGRHGNARRFGSCRPRVLARRPATRRAACGVRGRINETTDARTG